MAIGDLIQFTDNCGAIAMTSEPSTRVQMPLWPTSFISAGEIGVLLKSQYFEELGTLCEVLIGSDIFFDIPRTKIKLVI